MTLWSWTILEKLAICVNKITTKYPENFETSLKFSFSYRPLKKSAWNRASEVNSRPETPTAKESKDLRTLFKGILFFLLWGILFTYTSPLFLCN